MIDGISVAVPTYNNLDYLKKMLYSVEKYSVLPETEVSLFVDGATDGTFEWLEEEGIPHIGRRENKGAYSGWNRSVENCRNEYWIMGESDEFYGPEWDLKLAIWIEELGEDYIVMPQLVEPTWGSYPPIYDCGKVVEEFDEEKFVEYCRRHSSKHEVIADSMGFPTMKKSLFFSIGGIDEFYDPLFRGALDFQLRLSRAHPNLRWVRVWDSMIYHFPPSLHNPWDLNPELRAKYQEIQKRNAKYFMDKYGLNHHQAYASIPVGLK